MKYATSEQLKIICPNSVVQEVFAPQYEIELDFINNPSEQAVFFAKHENELVAHEVITCMFNNDSLPQANMISITPAAKHISYYLSMLFSFCSWRESMTLPTFINQFKRKCHDERLDVVVEQQDVEGYFVLATVICKPDSHIKQRVDGVSQKLATIIAQCLKS